MVLFHLFFPKESIYQEGFLKVEGKVIEIKPNHIILKTSHENILVATTTSFHLGDVLEVEGEAFLPTSSTTKYLFDYRSYLKQKNIFYQLTPTSIHKRGSSFSVIYYLKEKMVLLMNQEKYLLCFLLGDKSYIDSSIIRSYQENGISHLFAISGMHITLIAGSLTKLLRKKYSEEVAYKYCSCILLLYLFLVGFSPSILRGVSFYLFFEGNRIYYFYIKKENIFILILSLSLIYNPNYIFDAGFQFSYLISFSLLEFSSSLNSKNMFIGLLKVSSLSFLVGLPVCLYHYYQVNLLSILYNLFYVPFISMFFFPFTFIVFIFPFLRGIYSFFSTILEASSLFLSHISFGKIVFKRYPFFVYIIYEILILLFCIYKKKKYLYLFLFLLFIHFILPNFSSTTTIHYLDVGQGDSILIHSKENNILIDTGGNKSHSITFNTLIPYIKSLGISSVDYLILSHGDYDHMGEAYSFIENYKVKNVIFNCGDFNTLEKELIKLLDSKKIRYYQCVDSINQDSIIFLNTGLYDNENDNSNVIYMNISNYQFLFMGDAGIKRENDILDEYDLSNIDVLKVGHHGSRTSSGKEFIDEIDPKYSIISVGKNNRYGHPNKEVLSNLDNSIIYRTDQNGSIMFKIKNNKIIIETCSP